MLNYLSMAKTKITTKDVTHLAKLSNLNLSDKRKAALVDQIATVYEYVETLDKTDTSKTQETNQVSGLTNVWREDLVDEGAMLSQKQALQNAKYIHNGYFVVPAVLE